MISCRVTKAGKSYELFKIDRYGTHVVKYVELAGPVNLVRKRRPLDGPRHAFGQRNPNRLKDAASSALRQERLAKLHPASV